MREKKVNFYHVNPNIFNIRFIISEIKIRQLFIFFTAYFILLSIIIPMKQKETATNHNIEYVIIKYL